MGRRASMLTGPYLEPSRWGAAMALYMIGFISYGATLVFYAALFPRLARNTPHSREIKAKYEAGETSKEEYDREESLEKNRISNISTVCSIYFQEALLTHMTRHTATLVIYSRSASTCRFFCHWHPMGKSTIILLCCALLFSLQHERLLNSNAPEPTRTG